MGWFGRRAAAHADGVPGKWSPGLILFAAAALVAAYFGAQLLIELSRLWLMVFAAVVVAVLIRSVADPLMRLTHAPAPVAVAGAIGIILGVIVGLAWLFGAQMSQQVMEAVRLIPQGWAQVETLIESQPFGFQLTDSLDALGGYAERALGWAQTLALGTVTALTGLLLVLVAGVYLALEPDRSRDGVVNLFPLDRRIRMREVLNTCGRALKGWLRAQLLAMITVGVLSGVGLWLIGVPSPVALGALTFLLDFVPVVGPIAATIPAVLMAATVGWEEALMTLVLYVVVQQVESILIMPLAQKSVAKLPVILTVFSIVAFGGLFGPLGVLLSAPLALTLLVLVTMLYRQDVLGDPLAVAPGERKQGSGGDP